MLVIPILDIVQIYYQDIIMCNGEIGKPYPLYVTFLSCYSQGHIFQMIYLWFLPLYLLVIVGEESIVDYITGYKNILICKYGQPQLLPDGALMIYKTNAPEEFMYELETLHCIPIRYEDDATFYKVYRGSHTYDTEEMSHLIDGTVADAKELGIETMTPAELLEMKERWGV